MSHPTVGARSPMSLHRDIPPDGSQNAAYSTPGSGGSSFLPQQVTASIVSVVTKSAKIIAELGAVFRFRGFGIFFVRLCDDIGWNRGFIDAVSACQHSTRAASLP